jgi:hypothetical protein
VAASLAIVLVMVLTAVVWLLVRRRKAETLRSRASEPRPPVEVSLKAESADGLEPKPPGMAPSRPCWKSALLLDK